MWPANTNRIDGFALQLQVHTPPLIVSCTIILLLPSQCFSVSVPYSHYHNHRSHWHPHFLHCIHSYLYMANNPNILLSLQNLGFPPLKGYACLKLPAILHVLLLSCAYCTYSIDTTLEFTRTEVWILETAGSIEENTSSDMRASSNTIKTGGRRQEGYIG